MEQKKTRLADCLPEPPASFDRMVEDTLQSVRKTKRKESARVIVAHFGGAPVRLKKRALAALVAAAVLLLTTTAFAATALFARERYTPDAYLAQGKGERIKEENIIPDVEQAIEAAAPKDVSCTVRMLPELEEADVLDGQRMAHGQPAYAEADWAWLRDVKPHISDVLLDGDALIWAVELDLAYPERFAAIEPQGQWLDIQVDDAYYTAEGSTERIDISPTTGNRYGETDHGFTLSATTYQNTMPSSGALPSSGMVTVTETIRVLDCRVDDMAVIGTIALIEHTFTFDAGALQKTAEPVRLSAPLEKPVVITVKEDLAHDYLPGNNRGVRLHNERMMPDGAALDAEISYGLTGIYVRLLPDSLPASWTEAERLSLLDALMDTTDDGRYFSGYRVNGGEMQPFALMPVQTVAAPKFLIPVYPSEYGTVDSVQVELVVSRIVSANGSAKDPLWRMRPEDGEWLSAVERETETLLSFDVPIPKK